MFSRVKLRPSECRTGDTSSENLPEARRNVPFTASCGTVHGCFSSSAKSTSVNHAESAPQLRYRLRATMSFLSEMVTFKFFIFIAICWCSAAGLYANCVYATNIFLQFKCLIQPFICCQQNIKACRVLEADKTVWKDEDYNYCHRCPTKRALQCFSSPCLSLNVTTYRVKIKRWGHYWCALTTSWILSYF